MISVIISPTVTKAKKRSCVFRGAEELEKPNSGLEKFGFAQQRLQNECKRDVFSCLDCAVSLLPCVLAAGRLNLVAATFALVAFGFLRVPVSLAS